VTDFDPALLDLFATQRGGSLLTLKRDGRPQASVVTHVLDAASATLRVSVTEPRAKTRNLRRDPRAVLHINSADFWPYVALDGVVELSPVTTTPGDATGRELAEVYERAAGKPHPDWDEYFAAMVKDKRLVLRFTATSAAGITR